MLMCHVWPPFCFVLLSQRPFMNKTTARNVVSSLEKHSRAPTRLAQSNLRRQGFYFLFFFYDTSIMKTSEGMIVLEPRCRKQGNPVEEVTCIKNPHRKKKPKQIKTSRFNTSAILFCPFAEYNTRSDWI